MPGNHLADRIAVRSSFRDGQLAEIPLPQHLTRHSVREINPRLVAPPCEITVAGEFCAARYTLFGQATQRVLSVGFQAPHENRYCPCVLVPLERDTRVPSEWMPPLPCAECASRSLLNATCSRACGAGLLWRRGPRPRGVDAAGAGGPGWSPRGARAPRPFWPGWGRRGAR